MSETVPDNERLAAELRQLLTSIEATGVALLPASNLELLETVVEAAAQIFGAAAASISLLDEADQTLEFKVAFGAGRDEVLGMHIPLDQGIAGYVASTGQPIAISNVQQDVRFNQEFAKSTGYVPKSILATPLMIGDRVIGVMEVLDKINAATFGMQDMELLGVFARQAAMAIEQAQQMSGLARVLVNGAEQLLKNAGAQQPTVLGEVAAATLDESQAAYQQAMTMAGILFEIGQAGEAERRLCLEILTAFRDYLRARPGFGR
jgi:GAF domain-containing protein